MIQEAIAHQGRSALFRDICLIFREIEGLPSNALGPDLLTKKGLDKVIEKWTGLKIPVKIDQALYVNAWVYPPYIDANHAVLAGSKAERDDWWLLDYISEQSNKAFGKSESIFGTVDREKSRVSGDFCKIECPMFVTRGLLQHKDVTPEMATTTILHEIGHVFTYFEFMGRVTTFNGALQAASEAFFKCEKREDRLKIVRDVGDKFGVDNDDREVLTNAKSKDAFITVLARGYVIDRKSGLGSSIYDITLWESLSDQFSMRHGSGVDGVKMMDILYRDGMHASYMSNLSHIIFTLFKVLLFIASTFFLFGLPLLLLFVNPAAKIYDEPHARMQRMRNDFVAGLKSPTISAAEKARIAEDVKDIDVIMKDLDDKRGLIELFYTACTPGGRREYSQLRFQQEIESLVANDLLVASTRLSNLANRLS
jgi:hypothetical protein